MTIFDPDSMGLRYIYLDDPCYDTNPTGPVWSRMDDGIFASNEKSERPLSSSPSMAAAPTAGDRLVVARGRLTCDLLGQTELGRWLGFLWPRERERERRGRERERERNEGEKERERERDLWGRE
ncbi:hypothetical protein PanWU01x14_162830 [Parasponia andersonii]|uniref:Uncharacterized protein n=1 Tax=Parasponia andersonii TaxID=3476 RepID=A0A2P5CD53_PARAD|nr:hypothetical protein PanWU01x14_162830 [Parasponia andersonii]